MICYKYIRKIYGLIYIMITWKKSILSLLKMINVMTTKRSCIFEYLSRGLEGREREV